MELFRQSAAVELVLVRHAQPRWVDGGRSVLDPELTELGTRQAARVAQRLQALKPLPTELVVSPTRRTRQTAEPIAAALGLGAVIAPDLEEIRLPADWEGAPADQIGKALGAARHRPASDWWAGLPGGEPFSDFADRVQSALFGLLAERGLRPPEHPRAPWARDEPLEDRRLVVVGHGGTNAVITSLLLGIDHVPWAWERFITLHAAVTRLQARPLLGGWLFGLREHSDAGHLPAELRSR